MLKEVKNVVQRQGEPRRRWFMSAYFDLIVWYDEGNDISGFELCYGKPTTEKALCWTNQRGYTHHKVDDGELEPLKYKMTPIYVPDGIFEKDAVSEIFLQESQCLEKAVKDYVLGKISEFS